MSLNSETSWVLRNMTYAGLAIMIIGLLTSSFDFSDLILEAGILILIFTPVVGVLVSTKCLIQEKDRKWTGVAFILIGIIILGALITYLK